MRELKLERSITRREQDTTQKYLADVKKIPLLNAEEEVMLAGKIKDGDRAAVKKLVCSNLRFGVSVAKKYEGNGILLSDLISEGNFGLMKAAERFDASKGFKFISFAVWWIRQAIMAALSEDRRLVRLPANRILNQTEVWRAESELEQKLERMPTVEEIAEYIQLSTDKVKDCYRYNASAVSLDNASEEEDRHSMLNVIHDDSFAPADDGLIKEGLSVDLHSALATLPSRQRQILLLYFGISGDREVLIDEIAERLGLSHQCVIMNKNKALATLRNNKKAEYLRGYL